MIKRLSRKIKALLARFTWRTRNLYLTFKSKVKKSFISLWDKVTNKEKRDLKRQEKENFVRSYLNIGDEVFNIQQELDVKTIKNDLVVKSKDLKSKAKVAASQEEKDALLVEVKTINKVIKYLPLDLQANNKREDKKIAIKKVSQGMIYLSPALILLALFTFWPIINTLILIIYEGYNEADGSVTGYTLFGNFIKVIQQPGFIRPSAYTFSSALINTLILTFISVPISVILALLIAVGLNAIKPLKGFFQTIFFLPYVTNTIAIALVFRFMFNENFGLINTMFGWFGVDKINWLSTNASYWSVMAVLVVYSVWDSLAFKIMVFLSAIQNIDKQYYQAAEVDATPKAKVFRRVTVPLISPMIFYILVTSMIGALKVYSSVITLTSETGTIPGATYHMKTIVMYIYEYLNVKAPGNLSLAAASSLVLFGIILLFTLVQMQVSKRRVHY